MEKQKRVSKKRIHRLLLSIVEILRHGKTEFSPEAAALLAKRIERAANDYYPVFFPTGYFFTKLNNELVKCKFAILPDNVPFTIMENNIYHINANLISKIISIK